MYVLQVGRSDGTWVDRFEFETRAAAEAWGERSGYFAGWRVVYRRK